MNLYDKLKSRIDYNNHYTIERVLASLDAEFNKALKTHNAKYANDIIAVVRKIYDDFSSSFVEKQDLGETMSFAQRTLAQKMRGYIYYLSKKLKSSAQKRIKEILSSPPPPSPPEKSSK